MSDPTLIADLIRAGVDPDLVGRVAAELIEVAKNAPPPPPVLTAKQAADQRYYQNKLRKRSESLLNSVSESDRNYDNRPSPSLPPSPPPRDINSTPPTSTKSSPSEFARKAAFARFWPAWPNKVGKPAAEAALAKHFLEIDAIMAGLERYIAGKPADRAWLNPATFLNQRRWEDQPATPPARAGPSRNGRERDADFFHDCMSPDDDQKPADDFEGTTIDLEPVASSVSRQDRHAAQRR